MLPKKYGKQKYPLYSDILIDLSRLGSTPFGNISIHERDLISAGGNEDNYVFGKVHGIIQLTGNHVLNERVYVVIIYYDYINSSRKVSEQMGLLHLTHAIDNKNNRDPLKRWWDVIPVESIIKKIHLIEDYGYSDDSTGTHSRNAFFVNWNIFLKVN